MQNINNENDKDINLENYLDQKEKEDQEYPYEYQEEEPIQENLELIKKFKSLTSEEVEEEIKGALEQIRPFLIQDGGDLDYIGFENSIVKIRLKGACTSCPQSTYTLKLGIENFLKEKIPLVYEVEAID